MSHIIGKVYDLTQENFNKVIRELEEAQKENERLRDKLRNSGRELYGVWSELQQLKNAIDIVDQSWSEIRELRGEK